MHLSIPSCQHGPFYIFMQLNKFVDYCKGCKSCYSSVTLDTSRQKDCNNSFISGKKSFNVLRTMGYDILFLVLWSAQLSSKWRSCTFESALWCTVCECTNTLSLLLGSTKSLAWSGVNFQEVLPVRFYRESHLSYKEMSKRMR